MRRLVADCLDKQAMAESIRAHVDSYVKPILERHKLPISVMWKKPGSELFNREFVHGTSDLWQCDDLDSLNAYWSECRAAHIANGYSEVASKTVGYCPATSSHNNYLRSLAGLRERACTYLAIKPPIESEDMRELEGLVIGAVLSSKGGGEILVAG